MQIIKRAAGSTFLRHNFIFLTGSTFVAFLNYLYYPVLGRLLSPADFGEVQAIISFFLQTAVFLQVLGLVTVGIIKKYQRPEERKVVVGEIELLAILAGVVGFAVLILASPWLKNFLHFSSVVPFIIFAFAVLLGVPAALSNAFLQGFKRFAVLSWANTVGAASKLILSAGLVLAGFGTNGAILGLTISQSITVAYTYWLAKRVGRPKMTWRPRWPNITLVRPELRYAGLVLAVSVCVNLMLSIDIIAVKHYFSPAIAGLYAGIAVIARIIFFLTGPLAGVLNASVKLDDQAHNRALLQRSLALLVLLGGSTLALFTLFPVFVIRLLFGTRYLTFASQLPRLSLAIFILSLCNLLVFYNVMLRRSRIAIATSIGLVTMGILLVLQHQSIPSVVTSLIEGSVVLFILIIIAANWKGRTVLSPSSP